MGKYDVIVPTFEGAAPQFFSELIDTPASLTGSGLKFVRVKGGEDGMEYVDLATGYSNAIYVSLSGNDTTGNGSLFAPWRTLVHALSTITTNGPTNRYVIVIGPGIYLENNPIVMKTYVDIVSLGGNIATQITAANAATLILGAGHATLKNIVFSGDASNKVISMESPDFLQIFDCRFKGGDELINCDNINGQIIANSIFLRPDNAASIGISCRSGNIIGSNVFVLGDSTINDVVLVDGATAEMTINVLETRSDNVTSTIHAKNSGQIFVNSITSINADNSIRVSLNGVIKGSSLFSNGNVVNDIKQDDLTGVISMTACNFTSRRFDVVDWSNVNISFSTYTQPRDKAMTIASELEVGMAEKGRESVFGEGDSTSRGMSIFKYTAIGDSYEDVSDDISSANTNTVTLSSAIDDALYIGWNLQNSDYLKHRGFKVKVNTASVLGAGDMVYEFWNGTTWATIETMGTDANAPFEPKSIFKFDELGEFQIYYSKRSVNNLWAKSSEPGTTRFWTRIRNTAAITTPPVIEYIKLHTNRTEINDDGFTQYFGNGRPFVTLPWDLSYVRPTTNVPGNRDVFLSKEIDVGKEFNRFNNGAVDRVGSVISLPYDIDTSCGLIIKIAVATDDASAGDIRFAIKWDRSTDGDIVYNTALSSPATSPTTKTLSGTVPAPGDRLQNTYEFYLDISDFRSWRNGGVGDLFWITLERDGGHDDDTHGGDVSIISLCLHYTKWCEGGYF